MAEPQPDIQSILAALASQRGPSQTPSQQPPGAAAPAYPPPSASAPPPGSYPHPPPPGLPSYGGPAHHGLPAPAASGSVDLSALRPVNSGTLNFEDMMPQARAFTSGKGAASYDRPLTYNADPRNPERSYRDSRSRSPRADYHRDDRRGGHGRDHERDRSYSPPPRRGRPFSPRGGGGRDRSPLRGADDSSETIQIEASLVGLIIGRQGENLRRIEADSNCRVQFLAATDGGPFRQCRISGPRQRRGEVKTAIDRIIEDSGMGPLNRAPDKSRDVNRAGTAVLRDGEDHIQIMVPDRTVGLIIGRGGETIRDLQERSGCHINIVGESKSVNGLRPVNLIGTVEATSRAKDFIMEIVDSDTRGDGPAGKKAMVTAPVSGGNSGYSDMPNSLREAASSNDKINDAIYVPSDAVGMIIGRGGETIREMQTATGCKINVAQSSGPGEVQREIALIGARDSISRAKAAIEEKVEAVRQKSGGGGGGGGRGRGYQDLDRGPGGSYAQQNTSASGVANQAPHAASTGDGADPYAQYGGYQNYLALWYQSLMYQQQQQQQGGQGAPAPGA